MLLSSFTFVLPSHIGDLINRNKLRKIFSTLTTNKEESFTYSHSIPYIFETINSRPHVNDCKSIIFVNRATTIIIDHITHIFATSINNPVVSIKRKFVPKE